MKSLVIGRLTAEEACAHALGRFDRLGASTCSTAPLALPATVDWYRQDLNDPVHIGRQFSTVVCFPPPPGPVVHA